ncbi:MAG: 50S ribosomal protein L10 [Acidilobus sp.]|nr:MAG: Ribosomal protein L10 [uncultured Acidilobus sp. MG]
MSATIQRKLGRREPPEDKKRTVEELTKLVEGHRYVLFADLEGLPAKQLQLIRKQLRGRAAFKVSKKNLVYLALERKGLSRKVLEPYLKHGVLVIFTDENPFLLAFEIDKLKMPAPAKPGDKATKDIVIPEGDTGLRPGPIVSVFGKLKIPYEVRKGTIYIKSDTVVAKAGDVIQPELASLLQQLGIQPMEIGLKLVAAWDGKTVIPGDMLHLDIEGTRSQILDAERESLSLAVATGYFEVPEVVSLLLGAAASEATAVIRSAGLVVDTDSASLSIAQAIAEENAIVAALGDKARELGLEATPTLTSGTSSSSSSSAGAETKKEEKKEEQQETDVSAGLAGLFGS